MLPSQLYQLFAYHFHAIIPNKAERLLLLQQMSKHMTLHNDVSIVMSFHSRCNPEVLMLRSAHALLVTLGHCLYINGDFVMIWRCVLF